MLASNWVVGGVTSVYIARIATAGKGFERYSASVRGSLVTGNRQAGSSAGGASAGNLASGKNSRFRDLQQWSAHRQPVFHRQPLEIVSGILGQSAGRHTGRTPFGSGRDRLSHYRKPAGPV